MKIEILRIILVTICIILILCISYIYKKLLKSYELIAELSLELNIFKKNILDPPLHMECNSHEDNKCSINRMTNVQLIEFIKERFNLPDYCKMCDNFNPEYNHDSICRFKGMEQKCKEGFDKWLNSCNHLEGDMDADIN